LGDFDRLPKRLWIEPTANRLVDRVSEGEPGFLAELLEQHGHIIVKRDSRAQGASATCGHHRSNS
jgi:hypothetical protein